MDYFAVLEIKPGASEKEIKSAFRRLALKWHPDKNPNNEFAAEQFRKINEAYEYLMSNNNYKNFENNNKKTSEKGKSDFYDSNESSSYKNKSKNTSYSRNAKYYSSYDYSTTRKKSYSDPNFDEDTTEYDRPKYNTKPNGTYMNSNQQKSDISPFAKFCIVVITIILGSSFFFKCILEI